MCDPSELITEKQRQAWEEEQQELQEQGQAQARGWRTQNYFEPES